MASHYSGPIVHLADAVRSLGGGGSSWVPGQNRIRMPPQMTQHDFDDLFRIGNVMRVSDLTLQVGEPAWAEINNIKHRMTSRSLGVAEVNEYFRAIYDNTGPGEVVMRGRPVDSAFVVREVAGDINSNKIRVRLNATGGRNSLSDSEVVPDGIQLTCRILPSVPPLLDAMNVERAIIDGFKPVTGIVLVTGPTGSGKTTLMSSAIRHMGENAANSLKIIEYSAPIESIYDDLEFPNSFIQQVEVGRAIRLGKEDGGMVMTWAACVSNALRRKPDLIVIGEARDAATIEGCILACVSGHQVISSMHTVGAAETLRRAIMALPADRRAGSAIDLMEMSTMYVTQLLRPGLKKPRVAIREYVKFDAKARRKIIDAPLEKWTALIQDMMIRGDVECQRMIDSAKRLYDAGEIAEEEYDFLSSRQRGMDRDSKRVIEAEAPAFVEADQGGLLCHGEFSRDLEDKQDGAWQPSKLEPARVA